MSLLTADGVTVSFGGVVVLDGVGLRVGTGEVVGLIGPNGAGKSTFFNVLSGYVTPSGGSVRFAGRNLLRYSRDVRARGGIGRTFQTPRTFADATVLDNALVAAEAKHRSGLLGDALTLPRARRERSDARRRAMDALDAVGLAASASSLAGGLSLPEQRRLEVARALCLEPRLLLLDEVASGLTRDETDELAAALAQLFEERGLAVLLVEHDVRFVLSLADHLYVLDFGRIIADGQPAEVVQRPDVIEAYLGADPEGAPVG